MTDIDSLIRGSIDMHMHPAPDIIPSRVDALEAARQAKAVGMRGFVIKSHFYPSAPLATIVNQLVPEVSAFGSVCLDYEIGGLNHHALEAVAKLGTKIVWMPTLSSANSRGKMKGSLGLQLEGDGYSILDKDGNLSPEIPRILSIIKEYDIVLASGHISPKETFALFTEAVKAGIRKLIVTHASNTEVVDEALSLDEQKKLAGMGAYIEHTAADIMPCDFGHDPAGIAEMIKATGAQQCILSTDMGMAHTLLPTEGMRVFVSSLLRYGITPEEIELMIKVNPARLLGLD